MFARVARAQWGLARRCRHASTARDSPWLGPHFGWAEAVFTPLLMRFWCQDHDENFVLPDQARFAQVRKWKSACRAHSAAQLVPHEEVIKPNHDYALGAGNSGLERAGAGGYARGHETQAPPHRQQTRGH